MRIFTGRAGSGKTTEIMEEIKCLCGANEGKQILIVPELFSHAYERRLAAATDNRAARTAEVLSFSRLTGRVFAEVGGLADTMLSSAGQLLTMQEAVRRTEGSFKVYVGASGKPETVRELLRVTDELKSCMISPEQVFATLDALDDEDEALRDKLTDLAQLYTMYNHLCDESLPDPRDALTLLGDRLPTSHVFADATVYLDGFLGFTPQELHIIEQLIRLHVPVTAAITCDVAQSDIFVTGAHTIRTLTRMSEHCGDVVQARDFGQSKMKRPADLAVLEREALLPAREARQSDGESVHLYSAADPFSECEYAAAYIRRMVREKGARYRDFVIAARDMEPYAAALEMAMARYEVPIFMSVKTDLLQKPPMALILRALDTVSNGWRYVDFFACLKTGLCDATLDEVDRLENYALTWRVRGGAWKRPFDGHPDGYGLIFDDVSCATLQELNELRARIVKPFAMLEDALTQAQTAREMAQALYDFLETVRASIHMLERAKSHEEAGQLQIANEYTQLWEILVSAFEQFAWVAGDAPMDNARFTRLFALVLGEYDVGTIPVSLDRVTCGGMERVTSENVPHLILIGVNEGILPKTPSPGGVLTETDRLTLDGIGISLTASGAERMLMEQELLYRAIACPRDTLLMSCHLTDASGGEARPSYLLANIRARLTGVPTDSDAAQGGRYRMEAEGPCIELACAYLSGARTAATCAAYAKYKEDARVCRAAAQRVGRGPLMAGETAHALYGNTLNLTASRVDKFYSCRFAFFMQYGLRAKTRKPAEFSALEAGTFLHFVLENTLDELNMQEGGARAADITDAIGVMRRYVRQYVADSLGGLDDKPARFRYLFRRLVKTMEKILANVLDELRVSDFEPIDYELNFSENGDLPPILCEENEVSAALSGKVDRVDGYIKNGRLYVRVMDYKSGKKSFSLSDIWYGLNMQLVLYLYALQDEGLERYRARLSEQLFEIVPAGVLYVPTRDEPIDAPREIDDTALRTLREKMLRRSGLLTDDMDILEAMEHGLAGDARFLPIKLLAPKKGQEEPALSVTSAVAGVAQFGKLARYAQGKLIEMGHEVTAGDVRANPYQNGQQSYCAWCEWRAACQFDELAGDSVRILRTVGNEEFWDKIGGADDGDKMDG